MADVTTDEVWAALEKELFAVLGMVNARNEARTVGIVYIVENRKLYIATGADTWKARHVRANPAVSLTVPIAKRIPLMPWIKIPAATITFQGRANVFPAGDAPPDLLRKILRDMAADPQAVADTCIIEVEPAGDFITYGVGVSLMTMRHPDQSRGRAGVTGS